MAFSAEDFDIGEGQSNYLGLGEKVKDSGIEFDQGHRSNSRAGGGQKFGEGHLR